jgi:hypothetical protein
MRADLIVNGSFEDPILPQGTSYSTYTSIPGWTSSIGAIEIDQTPVVGGGAAAYEGTQSTELNSSGYQTLSQVVTGLVVGDAYVLSYAYGDRPGAGGTEGMETMFGGTVLKTNLSPDTTNELVWRLNSFTIIATSSTETLSFTSIAGTGGASFGNEIDGVSLVRAGAPEPSAILLSLTGVAMVLFAGFRMRRVNA